MSTTNGSRARRAAVSGLPPDLTRLWAERHFLPTDVLRSLADIWICASAVRMPQTPPDRFWDDDPHLFAAHDTVSCSLRRPAHSQPGLPLGPEPHEAVDQVFARRHRLSPGELLAVQQIWCCASGAQWNEPHEQFWELDLAELLSTHDTAACDDPDPWHGERP